MLNYLSFIVNMVHNANHTQYNFHYQFVERQLHSENHSGIRWALGCYKIKRMNDKCVQRTTLNPSNKSVYATNQRNNCEIHEI